MEGLKSRPAAKEEVKEEEEAEATEEKVVVDKDVCCMAFYHYIYNEHNLTSLHKLCDNSCSSQFFRLGHDPILCDHEYT